MLFRVYFIWALVPLGLVIVFFFRKSNNVFVKHVMLAKLATEIIAVGTLLCASYEQKYGSTIKWLSLRIAFSTIFYYSLYYNL